MKFDDVNIIVNCSQDVPTNSLVEDDATSELSVADLSRFIPRMPSTVSGAHVISIGQLLESVFIRLCPMNFEIVPLAYILKTLCFRHLRLPGM